MTFISWTIFGQYLDVTSNVLMSGLHRNRPLVDVILPLQCIGYLPRRVYIYLSNRSIKEKNGRSFPIPRLGCDVMDKTNSNDPYAHKGRFRIISGTGALQTYEIEGIIDLTA